MPPDDSIRAAIKASEGDNSVVSLHCVLSGFGMLRNGRNGTLNRDSSTGWHSSHSP
jgi:hypothetical protein